MQVGATEAGGFYHLQGSADSNGILPMDGVPLDTWSAASGWASTGVNFCFNRRLRGFITSRLDFQ